MMTMLSGAKNSVPWREVMMIDHTAQDNVKLMKPHLMIP